VSEALTVDEAEDLLRGQPVVPVLAGSLQDIKKLRDQCLGAGIPVLMGCPDASGSCCGTKTHLMVEESTIPSVARLLQTQWHDALAREGLPTVAAGAGAGEHPPCPACGTAAALVAGACSDCGLFLARE
jgi:hypothetical protein